MKTPIEKLSQSVQVDKNVAAVLQKRLQFAHEEFSHALREAQAQSAATLPLLLRAKSPARKPTESRFVA